jgi:hypothetical protein
MGSVAYSDVAPKATEGAACRTLLKVCEMLYYLCEIVFYVREIV